MWLTITFGRLFDTGHNVGWYLNVGSCGHLEFAKSHVPLE
jgi:hypothetical protein